MKSYFDMAKDVLEESVDTGDLASIVFDWILLRLENDGITLTMDDKLACMLEVEDMCERIRRTVVSPIQIVKPG